MPLSPLKPCSVATAWPRLPHIIPLYYDSRTYTSPIVRALPPTDAFGRATNTGEVEILLYGHHKYTNLKYLLSSNSNVIPVGYKMVPEVKDSMFGKIDLLFWPENRVMGGGASTVAAGTDSRELCRKF